MDRKRWVNSVLVEHHIDGIPQPIENYRDTTLETLRRDISSTETPSKLVPGNLFSIVIFKITGQRAGGCKSDCPARMRQMNEWGWWKCWKNRNTIIGWLVKEARARGHEIDRATVLALFKAAFKELSSRKEKLPDNLKQAEHGLRER